MVLICRPSPVLVAHCSSFLSQLTVWYWSKPSPHIHIGTSHKSAWETLSRSAWVWYNLVLWCWYILAYWWRIRPKLLNHVFIRKSLFLHESAMLRGKHNLFPPHGEGAGYDLFQRSTPVADILFQHGVLEPRSPDWRGNSVATELSFHLTK